MHFSQFFYEPQLGQSVGPVSKPTHGILQRQIDRVDEDYSIDDEADLANHEAPACS